MEDYVVLVDERDDPIGVAPKLDVHRDGRLHRAVSVLLFDLRNRLLLQRRAAGKYHSAGLWSNSCCGHPRAGESVIDAGRRRLRVELGIEVDTLQSAGHFIYRSELPEGLIEHELDHVLIGSWSGDPTPASDEVAEWQWLDASQLQADVAARPARYTVWLPRVLACADAQLRSRR